MIHKIAAIVSDKTVANAAPATPVFNATTNSRSSTMLSRLQNTRKISGVLESPSALKIENGVIEEVKFKTFGCGAAIATSSIATEMIKGKPIDEALRLSNKAVIEALDGLPPVKIHCSVLAEQAVKAAISDYYLRQGVDPLPIVGKLADPHACEGGCCTG